MIPLRIVDSSNSNFFNSNPSQKKKKKNFVLCSCPHRICKRKCGPFIYNLTVTKNMYQHSSTKSKAGTIKETCLLTRWVFRSAKGRDAPNGHSTKPNTRRLPGLSSPDEESLQVLRRERGQMESKWRRAATGTASHDCNHDHKVHERRKKTR